jgi:hypothetical protein
LADGLGPAALAPFGDLPELYSLELHLDRWSAEHARFLTRLKKLHVFTLVTPPGPWDDCRWLAELSGLPRLERVSIAHILPDGQRHYFEPLAPPFK